MNDRSKTLTAVAIIIGFFVLVIVILGVIITRKQIVSPVPEDNAIKIIFVTPTPVSTSSATPNVSPTPSFSPKKPSS